MDKIVQSDPRPPYVQIADAIRDDIDAGRLQPGDKLPSGRELAEQYGVALMTVQRALQALRLEGRIVSWQGRGSFVVDAPPSNSVDPLARIERLEETVRELADRVDSLDTWKSERGHG